MANEVQMYLRESKYEDIVDIRSESVCISLILPSYPRRLHSPPSFKSYCIDISNYSPRESTNSRAREPHSQSKRHAPQIRATWNTSTSLAALLYVETRGNNPPRPTVAVTVTAATTTAPKLVKLPAHAKRGERLRVTKFLLLGGWSQFVRGIQLAPANLALADARERNSGCTSAG